MAITLLSQGQTPSWSHDDATSAFPGRWSVLCHGCWRCILSALAALTRCFFPIPPFFLALMPVSGLSALRCICCKGKILFSIMFTSLAVGALFGALFIWLLG
ncbi:DUF3561 family protein [Salmonella enterica subsp. enterica serovar Weltevreden]|nr:DUF3561 family protein [Salmonella enterica subsp. enterica serovar Weltevreden]